MPRRCFKMPCYDNKLYTLNLVSLAQAHYQILLERLKSKYMKEETKFKIVCPFCNAPYTAQMELDLQEYGAGCETCGPGSADLKLEIRCSNCEKVVYVKEGKGYEF